MSIYSLYLAKPFYFHALTLLHSKSVVSSSVAQDYCTKAKCETPVTTRQKRAASFHVMKAKKYSVWISILRLLAGAHDRCVEQERRAFVVAGKMRFRSSRFLWESMTSNRLSLENDSQQVLAVRLPHHAYHLSDRHY
jgi:hypothetical protein